MTCTACNTSAPAHELRQGLCINCIDKQLEAAKAENATLKEQLKDYCVNNATICYQCGKAVPETTP